ncbi:MAG: hypothetical protein WA484_13265 [Solirubrobacteraceae bacterium]
MSRARRVRVVAWVALLLCGCLGASVSASEAATVRAFELVSPEYKGGFGADQIEAAAPDGEGVLFYSPGAFAGTPAGFADLDTYSYFAHRTESGWKTLPELPPDTLMPTAAYRDVSSSLDATLALGKSGPNNPSAYHESTQEEVRLHGTETSDEDSNWSLVGKPFETIPPEALGLKYLGGDGDLCHLLFANGGATVGPLIPEAEGTERQLYELVRGCDGEASTLRLVAIDSDGKPMNSKCAVGAGGLEYSHSPTGYNAVADGGHEIFFTTCIGDDTSRYQLFVRLDGAKTLEVSKKPSECVSEEVPCLPGAATRGNADFAGASEDGSRVFFTTNAQLTGEGDGGTDIYMAEIGCPGGGACAVASRRVVSLSVISRDPNGSEAAAVQGVVRVAPDGSRVYFVARGDLLGEAERNVLQSEGRPAPVSGADNLYVYDAGSGTIGFVADLCSGKEESGTAADSECPSVGSDASLWSLILEQAQTREAQTAGIDGEFLVFSTYARLVKGDTDDTADVYRFDALNGSLERVSVAEDGYGSNGNGSIRAGIFPSDLRGESVVQQHEMYERAISEDGSRIVFETTEPLSPLATNGLASVYEWHEEEAGGSVSLLAGGTGETLVEDAVITPAGRDVFVVTSEGLVPQDGDGLPDVYDARLGGGFAQPPESREPCSSDACQGPLTSPAPLLVPGSASQIAETVLPAVTKKASAPPKRKTKKKKRKVGGAKRSRASRRARRASGGHHRDRRRRG